MIRPDDTWIIILLFLYTNLYIPDDEENTKFLVNFGRINVDGILQSVNMLLDYDKDW